MARRPYHHGNLRQTLIDAAVELIAETGPRGFTLREAARRAGVSHNAPYRHFQDKDELLAAVAAQGFEELTRSMTRAARGESGSLQRLRAAGIAYIGFALRRPQHFTAMFETPAAECSREAGERAFHTLLRLIEDCQKAGELRPDKPHQMATVAWALVHGVAKLALDGAIPGSKAQILEFARFAIDSAFGGLTRLIT
jgi:AcrR family transcriptional regulator